MKTKESSINSRFKIPDNPELNSYWYWTHLPNDGRVVIDVCYWETKRKPQYFSMRMNFC